MHGYQFLYSFTIHSFHFCNSFSDALSIILCSATINALFFRLIVVLFCPRELYFICAFISFKLPLPETELPYNFLYPTFTVHSLSTTNASLALYFLLPFEFFFLQAGPWSMYILVPANLFLFLSISSLSFRLLYAIPFLLTVPFILHILTEYILISSFFPAILLFFPRLTY